MSQEISEKISQEVSVEIAHRNAVRETCEPFILDDGTLRKIKDMFLSEIMLGLCKSTHHKATVKCLLSYVQFLPTGCETGKFLALDLCGANFRILCIYLTRQENLRIDSEAYEINENLLIGPGKDLFDHIADCLAKFLQTIEVEEDEKLPLGFTFSFPYRQNGLDKGVLVSWQKGFNCSDVIGEDVAELLRQAIDRIQITNVEVTALISESTGTLMSCAWDNPYCKIGLNMGDALNCAYLEKLKNINISGPELNNKWPTMIINCEAGAFGDNDTLEFVRTKYDIEIDDASLNRRCQLFEKMVASVYLGELVRKLMIDCCKAGALFNGHQSEQLATANSFKIEHLSKIEEDVPGAYGNVKAVLEEIGYTNPSDGDCENVRYICESVSRRSAHLISTVLSSLIDRVGDPYIVIGIDGCIFQQHPYYHHLLKEKIKCLARPEYKFDITLSNDGAGRGAAVVAAVASSLKKKELAKTENKTNLKES